MDKQAARSKRASVLARIRYAGPAVAVVAYACLSLFGTNAQYLHFAQTYRALIAGVFAALLLVLALGRMGLSDRRSGLGAAAILLVFFSYGHIYGEIEGYEIGSLLVGRHRYLLPLVLGAVGLAMVGLLRARQPVAVPFRIAQTVGALAVLLSLVAPVGRTLLAPLFVTGSGPGRSSVEAELLSAESEHLPDVYYIVLDGYGRADVLDRIYQLDNSAFLKALEEMGFYVATEARANYIQTRHSLSAALNMDYVDDLVTGVPPALAEARVDRSILHSRVRAMLEIHGYETVSFESGYPYTEFEGADFYLTADSDPRFASQVPARLGLNAFETVLLKTTLLRPPLEWGERNRRRAAAEIYSRPHQDHRLRIRYALTKLPEVARLEGRQFVFVHILAPHPPFVFTATGEPRVPVRPYSLSDGSSYLVESSRTEYIDGYRQQVLYLNGVLAPTLRTVIEESEVPPVIVLQGDHGPGSHLDWRSVANTDLEERISILNAVYLPGEHRADLYPGLSSVNTFRVVMNGLFDPDRSLLADRSYYSSNTDPFEFVELDRDELGGSR